jgi:hypothetical protein
MGTEQRASGRIRKRRYSGINTNWPELVSVEIKYERSGGGEL